MWKLLFLSVCLLWTVAKVACLLPPKFAWKTLDFDWETPEDREEAISSGSYIPENNMPTGVARWQNKIFITIPRWKKGVPASLNYVLMDGPQNQTLKPYPSWDDGYVKSDTCCLGSNSTVVSTFRVNVDSKDRLWVVDNGATDMSGDVKQIAEPAILVFDLKTDALISRYPLSAEVLKESSVLTSIVVDIVPPGKPDKKKKDEKPQEETYAYIPDMGSNAIIVFKMSSGEAWRVENHYFHFDPHAGAYKVGGVEFYWRDGVSALSLLPPKKDGQRDLLLYPTSSTRQFKMSTKVLRNKNTTKEELFNAVEVIGDRGPNTQSTACDYDPKNNVLFYTQLSKNGLACWNVDRPFDADNTPLLFSDCQMMEFPNDVKVDNESNIWILSDRQSRFLYESMDFDQVNFRVLSAPASLMIQETACGKNKGGILSRMKSKSKTKIKKECTCP
ncbi:L-dopachrome tautomerase yellow-f-like isoform X2 [Plodia interpunctella]|uniref:L-dopachrome tautomerase yellow-f-like isoform X2 n=1 Tax=Plodia interpunctella TaxID=58824 RepID=UPI002367D1E8|nr:L-dopachrome tautomerase yellow-f-like isoform X2 [Plodia interpunctella]